MNKPILLLALLCAFGFSSMGQQTTGNYDPHAAFNPLFYTQMAMNTGLQMDIPALNTGKTVQIITLRQNWMKQKTASQDL
jgi:hypothetical protein